MPAQKKSTFSLSTLFKTFAGKKKSPFAELTSIGPDKMSVGGLVFDMSTVDFTQKTSETEVIMLKNPGMLDAYREIFENNSVENILEFGTWEGGSPLFFAAATTAKKILGIDIRDRSEFIDAHAVQFQNRLKLIYNTSQSDSVAVHSAIDDWFDGPIDLIIDDASHQYELTKAAFEIAFTRLKVGGIYIIEDWNWTHFADQHYNDYWHDQPALSNLALQLTMAVGSYSPIVTMEVRNWCLIITKGAEVEPDFKLDDLIRMGKNRVFHKF